MDPRRLGLRLNRHDYNTYDHRSLIVAVIVFVFPAEYTLIGSVRFANDNFEGELPNQIESKQYVMNAQKPAKLAKGFATNIELEAIENPNFRKVLYSGEHLQLVLMSLKTAEEIGEEIHEDTDQFFRVESGLARCVVNGTEHELASGDVLVVPAGAKHNIINADPERELKLYTIYAPPHHKDGIVRATKADAIKYEAEFDGVTTE